MEYLGWTLAQCYEVKLSWGKGSDGKDLTRCFKSENEGGWYTPVAGSDVAPNVKLLVENEQILLLCGANGEVITPSASWVVKAADGSVLEVQEFADGKLSEIQRGKDLFLRTSDAEDRPTLIEQKRSTTTIRKTYFKYAEASGVLVRKRVTVEEYNSDGTKRFLMTLYVYYGDGQQYEGNLWFVVEPEGVRRYLAAAGYAKGINPSAPGDACDLDDPETVTNAALDDYAEVLYTAYDASDRVTQMTSYGSGCCGGEGAGTYTFAYGENGDYPEEPTEDQKWNTWKTYRRTTVPGGLRTVEFCNTYDYVLFKVIQQMNGSTIQNRWVTHYVYWSDGGYYDGRIKEERSRAACYAAGYAFPDGSDPDGVADTGGWTETVTSSDSGTTGLVRLYDYHDPSGNIAWEKVRQGTSSGQSAYYVRKVTYTSHTYGEDNPTIYLVDNDTTYPTAQTSEVPNPDDRQITDHDYTFYADSNAVEFETVKHPTVSTANNGSNSQTQVVYHHKRDTDNDLYYNDWTKHEDGAYSYTELGTGTWTCGQVVKTVQDVDDTAGLTPPTGWDPPASGRLNLTTTYAYWDATGSYTRLKSVTAPGGQKTAYAYECQKKTVSSKETTTSLVTLVAPHMDGDDDYDYAPVQITVADLTGRTICSAAGDATTDEDGNLANDWDATDEDIYNAFEGTLYARTDSVYNAKGQIEEVRRYHKIPAATGGGSLETNYYRTYYCYDGTTGQKTRQIQVVSGTATSSSVEQVTKYVYDQLGRPTEVHRAVSGTDQDMTSDYDDETNLTFKKVLANFYDESTPGSGTSGVGDGLVTCTRQYYNADNANQYVQTIYRYNWRGQLRGLQPETNPYTVQDVDNLGRTVAMAQFSNTTNFGSGWSNVLGDDDYAQTGTDGNRYSLATTLYDEMGRVYETRVHAVTSGVAGDYVKADQYYDLNSRLVATTSPGQGGTEYAYDDAGRQTEVRLVKALAGADQGQNYYDANGHYHYRDPQPGATTGGDDLVIQIARTTYDTASNATESIRLEANHDDTNGLDVSNDDDYVQTAVYAWYDAVGRVTATADYGTCDGDGKWEYSALTERPSSAPARSDSVLVTSFAYNAAGRLETVTDPKNIAAKTTYDDLGRTVKVEEADGQNEERWTLTGYDGLSNTTQLVADIDKDDTTLSGGAWTTDADDQVTTYTFYNSTRSPYHAALPTQIKYPDGDDTDDNVQTTYALDGRPAERRLQKLAGQNDRPVLAFDYDDTLRRLTKQRLTQAGGVDTTVQSVAYAYSLGRTYLLTSYPTNDCSGTPLNQVYRTYNNAFGILWGEYQEHEGAADDDSSLRVVYSFATTVSGGVYTYGRRLTSVCYPNVGASLLVRPSSAVAARRVYVLYKDAGDTSGLGDAVSRPTALGSASTRGQGDANVYAAYSYNGASSIVVEDYPQPDVRLDYWGQTAGTYAGLDSLGRTKQQLWRYYGGTPADRDRFEYTYDRNSNRTSKDLTLTAGKDEKYAYDNLNRLTSYDRGTLSGGDITSKVRSEAWGLSSTGNWLDYQIDANGDGDYSDTGTEEVDQNRTHNLANEIYNETPGAAITEGQGQSAWADPAYSARGNMTKVPKPSDLTATYACRYDAWNRLAFVWVDSDADGTADAGETVIARYEYDALNRRTKEFVNADTDDDFDSFRHFYYNTDWQILETRLSTSENTDPETLQPEYQYIWSLRYIDAAVLRDKNTDSDDLCDDERLYYLNDANMNVTCLVEDDGDVAERYVYDPYGNVTVYSDDWSTTVAWAASKKNNIRFCGYFFDNETGLYSVRNRYYDFALGLWPSRDPIGYADGTSLYGYGSGRVINSRDPQGLEATGCCGPDITELLQRLLNELDNKWENTDGRGWDWKERNRICNGIWGGGSGDGSYWDVDELRGDLRTITHPSFCEGPCPDYDDKTGPCWGTVSVYGRCFDSAQVNYILWGKMNRLCGASFKATMGGALAYKTLQTVIGDPLRALGVLAGEPKYNVQNIPQAAGWTAVGYAGELSLAKYVPSTYGHCKASGCKVKGIERLSYNFRKGNAYFRFRVDAANVAAEIMTNPVGFGGGGLPSQLTNW
jgi:RHS repeat-associated protein